MKKKIIQINNIVKFPKTLNKLEKQVKAIIFAADEPLDIEKLLLGNGPPPDPGSLNLPSWEPTKCSVRENGFIMGYAANTN